jgi:hypothetical protein
MNLSHEFIPNIHYGFKIQKVLIATYEPISYDIIFLSGKTYWCDVTKTKQNKTNPTNVGWAGKKIEHFFTTFLPIFFNTGNLACIL